jgi:DNA cross-link repair 1A protein
MLFGAYTIGKERIYMAVAEHLGLKVYVDKRRYRILSDLELPPSQMARFTTRASDTCIWVVPLGHINMKKLPSYMSLKQDGKDVERVVGFRPTGWTLAKGNSIIKTNRKGAVTIHNVPYSEHSSFPELIDCLAYLRPKRIIPTVSVSKSQEQIDLLMRNLQLKQKTLVA